MAYIDEQIAKMLRNERKRQTNDILEVEEDEKVDELAILNGMEIGNCMVFDKKIEFQTREILNNRIKIYVPEKSSQVKFDTENVFTMAENRYNLGYNYVLGEDNEPILSWEEYRDKMQEGMKGIIARFKWLEEGCELNQENKLHYIEFLTMTGYGTIHNHMYIADTKHGRLKININYSHEEEKYWKPVVQAMIKKMEII